MMSPRTLAIFISSLALLTCGIQTADYRCFLAPNPVKGQPQIKKCVLTAFHDKNFDDFSPDNIDLGLDLSKKAYVYQVNVINRPIDQYPENAEVVVHPIYISELAERVTSSRYNAQWAGADCPYCFDSKGRRTNNQCVFSPKEINLQSPALDLLEGSDVRIVICRADDAALLTKSEAASLCPKSNLDVDIQGLIHDDNKIRFGVVVIPECFDAQGARISGRRVIIDPEATQKLMMNICNLNEVRYIARTKRQINPHFSIVFGKEIDENGSYTVRGVEEVVPTSSPVMLNRLTCSSPWPITNHFADRLPFAIEVNGGAGNPFFKKYWDLVRGDTTKSTWGEYLAGPSQGYDVYRLRI